MLSWVIGDSDFGFVKKGRHIYGDEARQEGGKGRNCSDQSMMRPVVPDDFTSKRAVRGQEYSRSNFAILDFEQSTHDFICCGAAASGQQTLFTGSSHAV